jgi:hypothetical protein
LKRFEVVLVFAIVPAPAIAVAQTQPASYSASWTSVDQHPAAPEWFKDAKFGIYFHWGAFGTAAFGSERYEDGFDNEGEVYDCARGGAGDITNPHWLTDDAVSPSSWCYTTGMGDYTAAQEIHTFIDHVSKNGSLRRRRKSRVVGVAQE